MLTDIPGIHFVKSRIPTDDPRLMRAKSSRVTPCSGRQLPDDWRVRECRALAKDVYLFTYRLDQGARVTRRATIWMRCPDCWQIVYHQGTIVEAARPGD